MAKGVLQRSNTCKEFRPPQSANNAPLRRSFRLPGSKHLDVNRDNSNNMSKSYDKITDTITSGKRTLSVARMAAVFQDFQQKMVTKSKPSCDTERSHSSKFNSSRKEGGVSKKISLFNKGSNNENCIDKTQKEKSYLAVKTDEQIDKVHERKLLSNIPKISMQKLDIPNTSTQKSNDDSEKMIPEISEEELLLIKRRKLKGRSNSALPPLRTLVITKEARDKRSLSLSLIPEDDVLSLADAVERRLNLSKETNLCDTDL